MNFKCIISAILVLLLTTPCFGRPPKVVKVFPENGAVDVKPGPTKVRILFDQDMGRDYSLCGSGENYPEIIGEPKWAGRRALVFSARLKPNHNYTFGINCPSAQNFKSIRGESAEPLVVQFRTIGINGNQAESPVKKKSSAWRCLSLLDSQTQSQLNGQEKFFNELFQFPQKYKNASESEKQNLEERWIKQLGGQDRNTATAAAAYLGMVKSQSGTLSLEKILSTPPKNGRLKWTCTRSLGQIRQESSIPILIDLLDDTNANTRVYARVSLAEITGVYLGDDKEKWTTWHKDPSSVTCTENECVVPLADAKKPSKNTNSIHFTLPDTYGRIVSSDDYLGSPTLYIIGSCWCGGCQQDMGPFRKFINQQKSAGLQGVRVVAGDNELASLDFQKHYRLNCAQLLDTNRKFEQSLKNPRGWTFLVLVDSDGSVVYRTNNPREDDYKAIYKLLKSNPISAKTETVSQNGIHYMPATIDRNKTPQKTENERFPSIALRPNGGINVVFTVSDNDSCDVIMREFDGDKWLHDIPIANSPADEYDGSILTDTTGKTWVCWSSNAKGRYDIFITSLDDSGHAKTPYQLTRSDDGAMHPRMACDNQGDLWITYYRWKKRNGRSRDKEVYIRKLVQNRWSEEIQVSPTDVPWYEDHTEPAITPFKDGVMIAWSWDFHPPIQGYSKYANTPTIFMRPVNAQMELGKIVSVSGKSIDVTPTLITSGNQVLCAWDSTARMKNLSISAVNPNQDTNPKDILEQQTVSNVCTPHLVRSEDGKISLLWSETKDGTEWILKHMSYEAIDKQWSSGAVILKDGNPRFPSAAYDSKGKLWVAYSVETENGRKIAAKSFAKEQLWGR